MDISKVISDAVDNASYQTSNGMIDLEDPNHLFLVREELKKHLDEDTIDSVLYLEANKALFDAIMDDADKKDRDTQAFMKKHTWLKDEELRLNFARSLKVRKKFKDFDGFIANLPSGIPETDAKDALNKFDNKKINQFTNFLWKYTEPTSKINYSGGAAFDLWDLKPAGAGKGEIFLAAICKNSSIQGGNKSFDLKTGSTRYEVKDYSNSTGAIRAGVEAAVSKFPFWNQILETVKVIQKADNVGAWDLIPDPTTKAKLIALKTKILKRVNGFTKMKIDKKTGEKMSVEVSPKIVTGEFKKEDHTDFNLFYDLANSLIGVDDSGYNEVRFYGSNESVARFAITKTPASSLSDGKQITIDLLKETKQNRFELLKNYLAKLEYVRTPSGFNAGIQAAMDEIFTVSTNNADKWIIFRAGKMNILVSDSSNFEYYAISQNGVKFKEK
jgi:hypothetical protein